MAIPSNPLTLAYKVYLNDFSGNLPLKVFDTTGKAIVTQATLSGLLVGHMYEVTVTAVNQIGESMPSVALTIHAGTVPAKIQGVELEASTTTSLSLRWDFPLSNGGLSLTQYTVYLDVGQTGAINQVLSVSDTLQNYLEVNGLTTGALVDVQISASNVNGEGEKSDLRTFIVATVPSAPNQPAEVQIFLPDYSKEEAAISVSWTAPASNGAPLTGYKLYFAEEAREYDLVYDGTGRSDILTYTVTSGILKGHFYKFRVSSINAIGESSLSPKLTSFIAVVPSIPSTFEFVSSASGMIEVRWEAPLYDGGATLLGYYIYSRKT